MAVLLPADEEWRRTAVPEHLDDLAVAFRLTLVVATDYEPVARLRTKDGSARSHYGSLLGR